MKMTNFEQYSDEELDVEIAEKVMGWHSGEYNEEDAWLSDDFEAFVIDWSPATEIRDAFQVLDHLQQQRDGLWQIQSQRKGKSWQAVFVCGYNEFDTKTFSASNETLPRAICLASLLALSSRPHDEKR
jgi:hypothetical protein